MKAPLIPLHKRIKIIRKGQPDLFGWLHELGGYHNILPQYFAILDDGTERDLRDDCYAVVEED